MTSAAINGILPAPNPIALEPGNPAARLVEIIEQLTNLIGQEIKILLEHRPKDIEPLQGEKLRLESIYREEYATLKRNPELLGAADSPGRARLRAVSQAFNETLIKLGRILLRKRTLSEGIVKTVADEAEKKRPRVGNYAATATLPPPKFSEPSAFSFDQSV